MSRPPAPSAPARGLYDKTVEHFRTKLAMVQLASVTMQTNADPGARRAAACIVLRALSAR
ncbi:MAG: hypothetical protein ACK6DR_03005 [Gemmatimonas sp.]|jgi:hypothetical protein|uniref:hypothetical protein n=1 Tax=Gemmatimonas sp. TaxID=1962908 RepID=UPI0022CCE4EE|nr:hypothetical protein [Gemmatimonas sp.]MCZ8012024.1 hypothetical protein [Gemmatimonas sp.]MCZ8267344.1 hypothetical protein [Gemmatimonas sp.]